MRLEDYDIRGRSIAHHFFDELEKIAYSNSVRRMYQAASAAEKQQKNLARTLGKKRFIPFTAEHRAFDASQRRANKLSNAAEAQAAKERKALLNAIKSGKGNQQGITKRLEKGPQAVGPVRRRVRTVRRGLGQDAPVENIQPAPKPKGLLSSPRARLAAGAVAVPLAGAGTLYAGQKYLQSQQDPYGGY